MYNRFANTRGKMNKYLSLVAAGIVCLAAFTLLGCKEEDPPTAKTPAKGTPGIENVDISYNESTGSFTLSWDPVTDAVGYEITHAGSRLGTFSYIEYIDVGPANFTYVHSNTNPYGKPNARKYENYYKITAMNAGDTVMAESMTSLELKIFGQTVLFYDANYDNMTAIRTEINRIHDQEMFGGVEQGDGRRGEFSSRRYTFFFKPGEYNLGGEILIGFYTTIAGLGKLPSETRFVNTSISTPTHLTNNNATCTFWRSIENLHLVSGQRFRWGVSQSAPIRRMLVNIPTLYHFEGGYCSGGYTGDSYFTADVAALSQQQWYTRNCHYGAGMSGVGWNNVIQATTGSPPSASASISIIPNSPKIREKPFIFYDTNGEFKVFKPAVRENAVGISWNAGSELTPQSTVPINTATNNGMGVGEILDLMDEFYITKAAVRQQSGTTHAVGLDSAADINAQLTAGKHIYFTPGRYPIEAPIVVKMLDTIILGHGFPTVYPTDSNNAGVIFVDDVSGVTVAGIMFDAGSQTAYLLTMGPTNSSANHSSNPSLIADLCLRIGGYNSNPVHADVSVLVNSNNVIGDKLWVWRADHGVGGLIDWHYNTSKNGVIVMGDNVEMYGLFVEHHHEYTTLWLGDGGVTYFYQNETPYDPHWQVQYSSHGGTVNGWAQYKVGNNVNTHEAYGLGIYSVFLDRDNGTKEYMILQNAIEVPHKTGVRVEKACTVFIGTGSPRRGEIVAIVNGTGGRVISASAERLGTFRNGTATGVGSNPTAGVQPADETHWVEALQIGNTGVVTTNPNGGLPPFASRNGYTGARP